jgi:hypothetical protein
MQRFEPLTLLAVLVLPLVLVGCQSADEPAAATDALFGRGVLDNSRVVARVNGYAITENMMELRFEELPRQEQLRYESPEGRRLFLREMVNEVLRVRHAEQKQLHRKPEVARVLISLRRDALDTAFHFDLTEGNEPDIEAVRDYFAANRDRYVRLGIMTASHVECLTREDAEHVYNLLTRERQPIHTVARQHSQNQASRLNGGELGTFNRGGFVPHVVNGKAFSERVWDFERGPNPPFEFEGRWQVVFVHDRVYERPQTLEEAYQQVVQDMLPSFHKEIVDRWQREARAEAKIEYFGEYRPGQGRSPRELLDRAFYVNDPMQKLDLLGLLVDDYPDSELADDALFLAANIALDRWSDVRQASFYLNMLLSKYPQSDYVDDATYMLENMSRPDFLQPRSIEDLRRNR